MNRNSKVKVTNTLALNQRCREYRTDGNIRRWQQAHTELGVAIADLNFTEIQVYWENCDDTATDWIRALSSL